MKTANKQDSLNSYFNESLQTTAMIIAIALGNWGGIYFGFKLADRYPLFSSKEPKTVLLEKIYSTASSKSSIVNDYEKRDSAKVSTGAYLGVADKVIDDTPYQLEKVIFIDNRNGVIRSDITLNKMGWLQKPGIEKASVFSDFHQVGSTLQQSYNRYSGVDDERYIAIEPIDDNRFYTINVCDQLQSSNCKNGIEKTLFTKIKFGSSQYNNK